MKSNYPSVETELINVQAAHPQRGITAIFNEHLVNCLIFCVEKKKIKSNKDHENHSFEFVG